jgi:hypothetical protein
MLDALDTSMACVHFFYKEIIHLCPNVMWKMEAYKCANIGKVQDHNTNKSLSISRVEYDNMINLATPRDMDVLSTYVTHSHPCDS